MTPYSTGNSTGKAFALCFETHHALTNNIQSILDSDPAYAWVRYPVLLSQLESLLQNYPQALLQYMSAAIPGFSRLLAGEQQQHLKNLILEGFVPVLQPTPAGSFIQIGRQPASIYAPLQLLLQDCPGLSAYTRMSVYCLGRAQLLASLSAIDRILYACQTLTPVSKLKRLLIRQSPRGAFYFEELLALCPRALNDAEQAAIRTAAQQCDHSYSLDIALHLINDAVQKTQKVQFQNTTKKWGSNTSIEFRPLARIAYALRLDLSTFDYLCEGSPLAVWEPLSALHNLVRYGLYYQIPLSEITDLMQQYPGASGRLLQSRPVAEEALNRFFVQHAQRDDMAFLSLLMSLGQEKETFLGRGKQAEELKNPAAEAARNRARCHTAGDCLAQIMAMIAPPENRHAIARRFEQETKVLSNVLDHLLNDAPPTPAAIAYENRLQDVCAKLLAPREHDTPAAAVPKYLAHHYYQSYLRLLDPGISRTSFLEAICDGDYFRETAHYAGKRALTPNLMNAILDGTEDGNRIKRDVILRLAYLHTLLRWLLGALPEEAILPAFTQKADEMLDACFFLRLHLPLPLDLMLYQSLAETELFKPFAYQMLLPRLNLK